MTTFNHDSAERQQLNVIHLAIAILYDKTQCVRVEEPTGKDKLYSPCSIKLLPSENPTEKITTALLEKKVGKLNMTRSEFFTFDYEDNEGKYHATVFLKAMFGYFIPTEMLNSGTPHFLVSMKKLLKHYKEQTGESFEIHDHTISPLMVEAIARAYCVIDKKAFPEKEIQKAI